MVIESKSQVIAIKVGEINKRGALKKSIHHNLHADSSVSLFHSLSHTHILAYRFSLFAHGCGRQRWHLVSLLASRRGLGAFLGRFFRGATRLI